MFRARVTSAVPSEFYGGLNCLRLGNKLRKVTSPGDEGNVAEIYFGLFCGRFVFDDCDNFSGLILGNGGLQ